MPAEIVEEILSKLPVKSLLRFSSVSKSWNLIINEARFAKKYRGGRQRMILSHPISGGFNSCPLPTAAAVSNNPINEAATELDVVVVKFFDEYTNDLSIRAVCDGLCCLENKTSLFIWNPTNGKFHKLPLYQLPTTTQRCLYFYGLGYDAVGDDYKLLRIYNNMSMLYSLRSNSWKEIQPFPKMRRSLPSQSSPKKRMLMSSWQSWFVSGARSWFVSGALHWARYHRTSDHYVIVSFDLSKEEYGEVALPEECNMETRDSGRGEVVVLRGKLCFGLNDWIKSRFMLWVMEDYGVAESWSKKIDIGYGAFWSEDVEPLLRPLLRPLCMYGGGDDNDEAIYVSSDGGESWVVLKDKVDGKTQVSKNFGSKPIYRGGGFVYVESPVSPPALVTFKL